MKKIIISLFLIVAITLAVIGQVFAQGNANNNPLYSVKGYVVEKNIKDPAKARSKAITEATKDAFKKILENITPRQYWYNHEEIMNMANYDEVLQKFSIVKEELEPNYKVTLDLFYNPQAIRDQLTSMNIPYSEDTGGNILVIPLFELSSRAMLWEQSNPWKKALNDNFDSFSTFKFSLPLGDVEEMRALTPEMAALGAGDIIRGLGESYDAKAVVVARARAVTDFFGDRFIEAEMVWYGEGSEQMPTTTTSISYPEGVSLESALNSAARGVMATFVDNWQSSKLIKVDVPGRVFLRFAPANVQDLEKIKSTVKGLNIVRDMKLRVMNVKDSIFQVDFYGDEVDIRKNLIKAGLMVNETRVNMVWQVAFADSMNSSFENIMGEGR